MKEEKTLGRQPLPKGEKKKKVVSFVPEKMIELLGEAACKTIAENSIAAEYEKRVKAKK